MVKRVVAQVKEKAADLGAAVTSVIPGRSSDEGPKDEGTGPVGGGPAL